MGAKKAQELAQRFGLTGRVDLYQAFTKAIANVLKPGGIVGLLTSNRFLTVKSGAALRHLLRTEFELTAIYDLGDTKLFSAAVLPVIVVARREGTGVLAIACLTGFMSPGRKCRLKALPGVSQQSLTHFETDR